MHHRPYFVVPVLIASALFFAGCASEKAMAEAKDRKEHPERWVQIYPLGSNVAVWVRKDQVQKTSDSQSQADQSALLEAQRRANASSSAQTPGDPASSPAHAGPR